MLKKFDFCKKRKKPKAFATNDLKHKFELKFSILVVSNFYGGFKKIYFCQFYGQNLVIIYIFCKLFLEK